LQVRYF